MRLDKYLKVSRLIKRRTVAKEVIDKGRVSINDKSAKAGTGVKLGDEIEIEFGQKKVRVRVEQLADSTKKETAASMYTLLHEERNQSEKLLIEKD